MCARRCGRDRDRRCRSRCSRRRAWRRRRRRTARGARAAASRRMRGDRGKRATTTSTATAKARSRSAGRGAQAADRDETRPVRAYRPNCRSRRRPNRPPGSFGQRITVERVEGAAAGFGVLRRCRPTGVPMASLSVGGRRFRPWAHRCRRRSGTSRSSRGWLSPCCDHLIGHAAPGLVVFEEFHDRRFGGRRSAHQRANLLAFGLALAGRANGPGLLLRIAAQASGNRCTAGGPALRRRHAGCSDQEGAIRANDTARLRFMTRYPSCSPSIFATTLATIKGALISATRRQIIPGDRVRRRHPCSDLNAGCRRANCPLKVPVFRHGPLRFSQPASLCRGAARGGRDGRARARPGALPRRGAAAQIRRSRSRLQRPRRRMERNDRGEQARR